MQTLWAAWAAEGFLAEFRRELEFRDLTPWREEGNLFLFQKAFQPLGWAACHWQNVEVVGASSIGAAAKELRGKARVWRHVSAGQHRRGELLLEQLRGSILKPLAFPEPVTTPEALGAFAWLSKEELVWSRAFDRPDPAGALPFVEDKSAPSRAYLKLWEAFTLRGEYPAPGELCVDLGASPGGWTYITEKLGARTISIDRSPLEKRLMEAPLVEFRSGDAFQFLPEKNGPVDWLLSDVICYPEKLFPFIEQWVKSGKAKRMVITIKFRGEADPAAIAKFQELGRVLHLAHNKHELTFFY